MTPANLGKVLVTGGGGFLGTAVIKLLVQRGCAVRSLCRRLYAHSKPWALSKFKATSPTSTP